MNTLTTHLEDSMDATDRIMPPNLEYIRRTLPHRLYADLSGKWMEILVSPIDHDASASQWGNEVVFGVQMSWLGGGLVVSFYVDQEGFIHTIDRA